MPEAPKLDFIVPVPTEERSRAFATLMSAFRDDPVERWLYPGDDAYERHFPAFLEAFGGPAFDAGTVWRLGDFDAVALWLPPGAQPDGEAIVALLTASVAAPVIPDALAMLEQMDAAHPREPHWYLPWLGVQRQRQGLGLGDQLLRHGLDLVDETHLAAYPETPNPRTVPFYERHGFVVAGGAQIGACPPITFMQRVARVGNAADPVSADGGCLMPRASAPHQLPGATQRTGANRAKEETR